jgi:hypothetical protein
VVALAGYYTPDGYQHALVATANGQVHEVYFNPTKGISQDVIAHFNNVVALAGYYTPDGYQHALVATANGQVHEVYFNPTKGISQDVIAQF